MALIGYLILIVMKPLLKPQRTAAISLRADWDELVFRGRNHAYGAYTLRKAYEQNTLKAFGISVGLLMLLMFLHFQLRGNPGTTEPTVHRPKYQPDEKVIEIAGRLAPPIMRGTPAPRRNTPSEMPRYQVVQNEPKPEPKPAEEPKPETQPEYTAENGTGAGELPGDPNGSDTGTPDGVVGGTGTKPGTDADMPNPTDFFNGQEPVVLNMKEFSRRVGYPPLAKEATIQGKVVMRVLVDTNGTIMRHLVLRNPHETLTREVERNLGILRFKPGQASNQRKVRVWVNLPVDFRLK